MIRLRSDCLEFELSNGEKVPASAQTVTVELMGSALDMLEPHIVENAAAAVLHYFRVEQGKESVTLSEFTSALETALRGLGINVTCDTATPSIAPQTSPALLRQADLRTLAAEAGKEFELGFFNRLRDTMRRTLSEGPAQVRFSGLRSCVKQLSGARRWCPRCQALQDQIVEYLRSCLAQEQPQKPCELMVS
jgi:hypothetical protein